MLMYLMRDLARRFPSNPLLGPADIPPSLFGMKVECLLNPGVFRFEGKTWLILRVAERPEQKPGLISFPVLDAAGQARIIEFPTNHPDIDLSDPRIITYKGRQYLTTLSHLRLVSSNDGIRFSGVPGGIFHGQGELESYGIEDCRVVEIEGTYHLSYTQVSPNGVGVGLRSTRDWKILTAPTMIFPPHNKDCAIFDRKINGSYYALHRPSSVAIGGNYIWIAESPDLLHWGKHRCLATTRAESWDSARVGAGGSSIYTPQGWLEIYHGATAEHRYCLGALLLDLNEPWKVLARSVKPIMEPLADYEQTGFFGHVVFTNGHLVDGDRITIYYGASDSVVCGADFSLREILDSMGAL